MLKGMCRNYAIQQRSQVAGAAEERAANSAGTNAAGFPFAESKHAAQRRTLFSGYVIQHVCVGKS